MQKIYFFLLINLTYIHATPDTPLKKTEYVYVEIKNVTPNYFTITSGGKTIAVPPYKTIQAELIANKKALFTIYNLDENPHEIGHKKKSIPQTATKIRLEAHIIHASFKWDVLIT